MSNMVHLITTTDETGLHLDRDHLERAGIKPGSPALVEIRPYTEEDWVADGERTFSSSEEFLAYLGACPSHVEERRERCRCNAPRPIRHVHARDERRGVWRLARRGGAPTAEHVGGEIRRRYVVGNLDDADPAVGMRAALIAIGQNDAA